MNVLKVFAGIVLLWILPGFLVLGHPRALRKVRSLPQQVLLWVAMSVLLDTAAGYALLFLRSFTEKWVWAAVLAINAGCAMVFVWRRKRAGSLLPWEELDRRALALLAGTLAVIMAPRVVIALGPHPIPLEPDSWVYLLDSTRLISQQHVPERVYQWGTYSPFPADKLGFQIFTAMFMLVTGQGYFAVMSAMTLLYTLVAALGVWMWTREYLTAPFASVVTLLVFFDGRVGYGLFANRFGEEFFRSEAFAIMLGVIALWLTARAVRKQDRRQWWMVPLLLILMANVHAVPALVTAILIVLTFAANWIVHRRFPRREVLLLIIIGGISLLGTGALYGLLSGSPLPGFLTTVSDTDAYQEYGELDPTYQLRLRFEGRETGPYLYIRPKEHGRFYEPPGRLGALLLQRAFPAGVQSSMCYIALAVFLFAGLLLSFTAKPSPSLREVSVISLLLYAAVYALALLFSLRYETYSQALHPVMREYPYAGLGTLLLGGALAEAGWSFIRERLGSTRGPVSVAYALGGVALALFLALPSARDILAAPRVRADITWEGVAALEWIRDNTPQDAVLLTNLRTAGSVELLAERLNVMEGRGVYLNPALLKRAFAIMDGAQCFYHDPYCTDIVEEYGVDIIVWAPQKTIGDSLPDVSLGADEGLWRRAPFVSPWAHVGDIHIYQVDTVGK